MNAIEDQLERQRIEWKRIRQQMGRTISEWRGKHADSPIPPHVKQRILETHGRKCYLTGRPFSAKEQPEYEHVIKISTGGASANVESNIKPVHGDPHKAKSSAERTADAKNARTVQKHFGIAAKPKSRLPGHGFRKSEGQHRATGKIEKLAGLARPQLFHEEEPES